MKKQLLFPVFAALAIAAAGPLSAAGIEARVENSHPGTEISAVPAIGEAVQGVAGVTNPAALTDAPLAAAAQEPSVAASPVPAAADATTPESTASRVAASVHPTAAVSGSEVDWKEAEAGSVKGGEFFDNKKLSSVDLDGFTGAWRKADDRTAMTATKTSLGIELRSMTGLTKFEVDPTHTLQWGTAALGIFGREPRAKAMSFSQNRIEIVAVTTYEPLLKWPTRVVKRTYVALRDGSLLLGKESTLLRKRFFYFGPFDTKTNHNTGHLQDPAIPMRREVYERPGASSAERPTIATRSPKNRGTRKLVVTLIGTGLLTAALLALAPNGLLGAVEMGVNGAVYATIAFLMAALGVNALSALVKRVATGVALSRMGATPKLFASDSETPGVAFYHFTQRTADALLRTAVKYGIAGITAETDPVAALFRLIEVGLLASIALGAAALLLV